MRRIILGGLAVFALVAGAEAQGIDCTKGRTAIEKAICSSPALLSLDREIAAAYTSAVARNPAARDSRSANSGPGCASAIAPAWCRPRN